MSLHRVIKDITNNLNTVIDNKITSIQYNLLDANLKTDQHYLTKYFCNNQGDFSIFSYRCVCDMGKFGLHCQIKGIDYWGNGWTAVQTIFGLLFGLLAIFMWIVLIRKIKSEINLKTKVFHLLISPKYLVIMNLVWITTARFFFIIIDPFCQRNYLGHSVDNIVFNMIYSAQFSFLLIVLIVWNGLRAVFDMGMKTISKRCYTCLYHKVKLIMVIMLIATYPVQMFLSYLQTDRIMLNGIKVGIIWICGVIFVFFYFGTLTLILVMRWQFYKKYTISKIIEEYSFKVVSRNHNKTEPVDTGLCCSNKNDTIRFLDDIIRNNHLDIIEDFVFNKQSKPVYKAMNKSNELDIRDQADYGMDYEKEIMNFDCYKDETIFEEEESEADQGPTTDDTNCRIAIKTKKKNLFVKKDSKTSKEGKKSTYEMTSNDIFVMNNLFKMSYAFLSLTVFILASTWSISFATNLHSPGTLITFIILDFLAEICEMIIIYCLFFRNSEQQEYKNLKIIGEIDKYLNECHKERSMIVFSDIIQRISFKRFQGYIKTYTKKSQLC